MIITIIADVYGNQNNGTAITAQRLIESLKKRGHEVRLVSPYDCDREGYYTVPKRNFYCFNNYIEKNGVELAKPDLEVLEKAIKGSDVVHIMMPFKLGRAAVRTTKAMHIPCTAAFHCQPENFSSHVFLKDVKLANDYLYRRFRRVLYRHVKHIHCPSEYIASELSAHKYKAKLHVISNGVAACYHKGESERPDELKDKFLILFTGRFVGEKRHDLLIKGVAQSKYRDKIRILLAGKGPKEDKIIRLAKKLKLPRPIIGFYTPEELNKVINYCDLYVHPADVEIEAISALEAITCGLVPVINESPRSATRFFALDDRCLFDGTPQSLAAKIDYWIEHPEEKREMSDRYIEYSCKFNLDRSVDQMLDMFNEAIKDERK